MKDYLTVATVVKPQGIRGEVKVLTMTDAPEDLQAFERVYIGGNCHKLLKVRPQGGNCAFITLSGIADRNAAELLRGQEIKVDRADAPALPEDTFYIADVIGCKVVDDGGAVIGTVKDITPARTDIYEVLAPDGKIVSFPAVSGLITDVNLQTRTVTVVRSRFDEVSVI